MAGAEDKNTTSLGVLLNLVWLGNLLTSWKVQASKMSPRVRGLKGSNEGWWNRKWTRAEVPGLLNASPDMFLVISRLFPRDQNRDEITVFQEGRAGRQPEQPSQAQIATSAGPFTTGPFTSLHVPVMKPALFSGPRLQYQLSQQALLFCPRWLLPTLEPQPSPSSHSTFRSQSLVRSDDWTLPGH